MKILLVGDDLRTQSGIARQSRWLAEGLAKTCEVHQLALSFNTDTMQTTAMVPGPGGTTLHLAPYGVEAAAISAVLGRVMPDVVVAVGDAYAMPGLWRLYDQASAEDRAAGPKLVWWHVLEEGPRPYYLERHYRLCDRVVGISKLTQSLVQEIVALDNPKIKTHLTAVHYIPHTIPESLYRPLLGADESKDELRDEAGLPAAADIRRLVFWNNRALPRKNLPTLLEAWNLYLGGGQSRRNDMLLIHAPADPDQPVEALVKHLCPSSNVRVSRRALSDDDLNVMYNASDLVVNIAAAEGFGLSTLEGMMAGTPALVSGVGGLQEQVPEVVSPFHPLFPIQAPCRSWHSDGAVPYQHRYWVSPHAVEDRLSRLFGEWDESFLRKTALTTRDNDTLKRYNHTAMVVEWETLLNDVVRRAA